MLSVAAIFLTPVESSVCRHVLAPSCACREGVAAPNGTCTVCSCSSDGVSRDCSDSGVLVPCETLHAGGCTLTTTLDAGYAPPGDQPCYVTVDIHEGIQSVDNPLQVHRCGNITINSLVSFQCDFAYKVSVKWTVRGHGTFHEILPDRNDVFTNKLKLDLPSKTLPAGLIMVQVTVTMDIPTLGHTSIGVAQTWVEVLPFPIVATTNGLSARTLIVGHFFVVASLSHDPDCRIPRDQLSYTWTCEAVHYPNAPGKFKS
ncbi:hypothetical protein Bbelb_065860 [Branchiostoma belcheri]|nr:hypothetical protein Bbelb_065860 [Branchiostoma belcheri]